MVGLHDLFEHLNGPLNKSKMANYHIKESILIPVMSNENLSIISYIPVISACTRMYVSQLYWDVQREWEMKVLYPMQKR